MKHYTDEDIVNAVSDHNSSVLNYLYGELRPMVLAYILRNNGSEADAKDVLQDGIIAFYDNVGSGKFTLQQAKATTYIFQICKYVWSNNQRSARMKTSVNLEDHHSSIHKQDPEYYKSIEEIEKIKKVETLVDKLGEKCQQLLTLFYFEKKNMNEINEIMGFKGNTSKNEKYRCMKKLRAFYAAK